VIILTKPQLTHTISGSKHTGQLSNSQIPDYITRDSELSTVSGVLQSEIDTKSDLSHLHDDRYYTESEVDVISGALQSDIDSKAAAVHQHAESDITNLDKYTQAEVDAIVADINSDISTVSGIVITDHGALSGRGDDDHLQYHTDGRGDTRYYTKTLLNAGQLDNRYYTESEVDSALSNKSDVGHQHTESDVTNLDKYTQAEVDSLLTVLSGSLGSSNFQSFLDLTDTPSSYFPSQFAQSTGSGIIWTTISGLNGADGEDGYSWTTGSGVPDDDSENEDFWFYLDEDSWDVYCKDEPVFAPNNRDDDIISCSSNGSGCVNTYDGSTSTYVYSMGGGLYVTYDFGSGYTHAICRLRIYAGDLGFGLGIADFEFSGSNNNVDFDTIYSGHVPNSAGWHTFDFTNETAYRYLKITITSSYALGEFGFHSIALHSLSGYDWRLVGNIKGAAGANGVDGADGADGIDAPDTFLGLTDTPSSYSSGKFAQSTGSGIQWAEVQAAGDYITESEFSTYSGTLQSQIDSKADTAHSHNDLYYTESEVDTISGALNVAKSDIGHTHDDRYYTEDEIGDQWNLFQQYVIMGIETKADLEHTHTEVDVTNLDKYTTSRS
jgi:hypothetical protein